MPVALIVKQPDLGTAILVLSAGLYVIFFAGLSWRLILPVFVVGAVAIGALVGYEDQICQPDVKWPLLHDYQKNRVCTLLDPTTDPLGKGFHIIQGMIAIGSGGLTGKGFMQGTQTHLEFIPERTTDFIFAAFSEEFGLVGCIGLLLGFTFLIFRGLMIAAEAPTVFTRLLAGAITLSFFTYAFVNMGMVSGILPVVGVPLPFISYGGTAMVTLGLGARHPDVDLEEPAADAELRLRRCRGYPGGHRSKARSRSARRPSRGRARCRSAAPAAPGGRGHASSSVISAPCWFAISRTIASPSRSRRRWCRARGRTAGTPARARPRECRGRCPRPAAPRPGRTGRRPRAP